MKRLFIFISIFIAYISLQAHTLLMNVIDNEDDTITVVGEFSTGDIAAGAMVRLESLISGEILYKKRLPELSELTMKIPTEPYQIVLDGGPGHTIVKEGIEPINGFSKQIKAEAKKASVKLSTPEEGSKDWGSTTIFLFTLCLVLLILTLYFSARNTNKILAQIKKRD